MRVIYLPRAVHAACSDTLYGEACLAKNQTPVGSVEAKLRSNISQWVPLPRIRDGTRQKTRI